jgi:hypothetical protein
VHRQISRPTDDRQPGHEQYDARPHQWPSCLPPFCSEAPEAAGRKTATLHRSSAPHGNRRNPCIHHHSVVKRSPGAAVVTIEAARPVSLAHAMVADKPTQPAPFCREPRWGPVPSLRAAVSGIYGLRRVFLPPSGSVAVGAERVLDFLVSLLREYGAFASSPAKFAQRRIMANKSSGERRAKMKPTSLSEVQR